ncbi:hypothetical protein GGR50DRAFT_702161 [Xylaria sp. CBS 124048]|nr:hypothetical protein GGR50DRAFT_702161 [Xylaria sp. CBS 124048]
MQPLNPFLASFFKPGSSVASQCTPIHHHILLVPTTEFFLTSREVENGQPPADIVASDEFLASHVLRITGQVSTAGGKDSVTSLRDWRGKPKEFSTLNGRTVVIKDTYAYPHKGFKTTLQCQLLTDVIWYADTNEPRQWLIYYISRPLIGTWEDIEIPRAIFTEGMANKLTPKAKQPAAVENGELSLPKKKDIRSFQDLLDKFPIIAKQMQAGLDTLFKEFNTIFEKPLPPPPSAAHIPDPVPDGPIATAMKKVMINGAPKPRASIDKQTVARLAEAFAEDDEDVMRVSLETAIMNAIDLFQGVDTHQLSMLGATTELTGPLVERLIERYVAENVNNLTWPRLALLRRPQDQELEAKIRQMESIDISQLGVFIEGSLKKKRELVTRLSLAIDEFRKMSDAKCPQDMMEILLSTIKATTQLAEQPNSSDNPASPSEKMLLTVNADTLVALLLFVVIRAGVKNLQARLLYMKHFIFIDDVDSGEMGYALSTFEGVLSYLLGDSRSLRQASRRNKALWDAIAKGDLDELKTIVDPTVDADEDDTSSLTPVSSHSPSISWSMVEGSSRRSSLILTPLESYSNGSGLSHVFPFQNKLPVDVLETPTKKAKRVAMDTRSISSSSGFSYHSLAGSIMTAGSGLEGDTSVKRLCQTQDSSGESIPMMAVQNKRPEILKYLLSLGDYFPKDMILEDTNNEGTSLLSAAIQLGHTELIDIILDFVMASTPEPHIRQYLALQDVRGRSVAHYLFHAPALITRIGKLLPWRQKDRNGQTPLFALCRSYDHPDYCNMVQAGLEAATMAQGDGQALHIDDHVDGKGNTLLHIANDPQLAVNILLHCDVNVNAMNEKKFTALMVASKYSRFETVRALYSDPRVDIALREARGLTAVELAKDDDVRNRIDDMALFTMGPGIDGRITGVVRSFFVEDATIRLVLKSGAPSNENCYTVTTCRRSMADFERLTDLLSLENPASWTPKVTNQRSPFQIPSKPSRSTLRDVQLRTNIFLKTMLLHPTFATHEMLWEFFLVPDLQAEMMEQRSRLKAETRVEKVKEETEPLEELVAVEDFIEHARGIVRNVNGATKSLARRVNAVGVVSDDIYDAGRVLYRMVADLAFLPATHIAAFEAYSDALLPPATNPPQIFHTSLLSMLSTIQAVFTALSRPPKLIAQINMAHKSIERYYYSMTRSSRWPLGLLDEARQRMMSEKQEKIKRSEAELDTLSRELRYTQQTVASELAGWHEVHARMGRRAIRDFAKGMLICERERLQGIKRALRKLRDVSSPETVPIAGMQLSPVSGRSMIPMDEEGLPTSDGEEDEQELGTMNEEAEEDGIV